MGLADLNDFFRNRSIAQYGLPEVYPILPPAAADDVVNRGERHS